MHADRHEKTGTLHDLLMPMWRKSPRGSNKRLAVPHGGRRMRRDFEIKNSAELQVSKDFFAFDGRCWIGVSSRKLI